MIKSIITQKQISPNYKAKELIFIQLNSAYKKIYTLTQSDNLKPTEAEKIKTQLDRKILQVSKVLGRYNSVTINKIGDI